MTGCAPDDEPEAPRMGWRECRNARGGALVRFREGSGAYDVRCSAGRRRTPMAGFQTLLGLRLTHEPITYRDIIDRAA
jgi:hypothetical protein